MTTAPIAVISLERVESAIQLVFEFPGLDSGSIRGIHSDDSLKSLRASVSRYLHDMQRCLLNYPPSYDEFANAIGALCASGQQLGLKLLNDDTDKWLDLQEAFRSACPVNSAAEWNDLGTPVPVVEVVSDTPLPFFDILPVFEGEWPDHVSNTADAQVCASAFLGFGASVHRISPEIHAGEPLVGSPTVAVKFLRHRIEKARPKLLKFLLRRSASRTNLEAEMLQGLSDLVEMEGPWPDRELEPAVVRKRVIDTLYDPMSGLDGSAAERDAHIHHFACHCDTSGLDDDYFEILVSSPSGTETPIDLRHMRLGYISRAKAARADGSYSKKPRSLVVFNACGSSVSEYHTSASFPKWFLMNRHRGFLGTESYVPNDVASDFCARFYQAFLGKSVSIAESLVRARRQLLTDFCDPTGIIYSYHGDPDLTFLQSSTGTTESLNHLATAESAV